MTLPRAAGLADRGAGAFLCTAFRTGAFFTGFFAGFFFFGFFGRWISVHSRHSSVITPAS
jgi:hypothetical protein